MDRIEIIKINNGLSWNNNEKIFTKKYYEESYNIPDTKHIVFELNENIIWFDCDGITIDSNIFNDPIEVRNYVFNI
jgi:hypothetical protein